MKQKYLLLTIILSVFLILFFTTSLALIPVILAVREAALLMAA